MRVNSTDKEAEAQFHLTVFRTFVKICWLRRDTSAWLKEPLKFIRSFSKQEADAQRTLEYDLEIVGWDRDATKIQLAFLV